MTYKSEGKIERKEIEFEISYEIFAKFKECIVGKVISKTRYIVTLEKNLIAEVDIYDGELEGLKVVEVEFQNIESAVSFDKNIPFLFGKNNK